MLQIFNQFLNQFLINLIKKNQILYYLLRGRENA